MKRSKRWKKKWKHKKTKKKLFENADHLVTQAISLSPISIHEGLRNTRRLLISLVVVSLKSNRSSFSSHSKGHVLVAIANPNNKWMVDRCSQVQHSCICIILFLLLFFYSLPFFPSLPSHGSAPMMGLVFFSPVSPTSTVPDRSFASPFLDQPPSVCPFFFVVCVCQRYLLVSYNH